MTVKGIAEQLLKDEKLKITSQRLLILNVLLANSAKSYSSIELFQSLEEDINRSTIYRSLDTLLSHELILKMVDVNGDTFYIVNLDKRCEHTLHPHLKCDRCGVIECLPPFPTNYVSQLRKSGINKFNVVLGGICSACAKIE